MYLFVTCYNHEHARNNLTNNIRSAFVLPMLDVQHPTRTYISTGSSCIHINKPYLAFEQMPDFTSAAMIVRKSAFTSFTSHAYLS